MGDHDGAVIGDSVDAPERFAAIFDRHYGAIDAYCVRRLGSDGHDVSAATFLEAFRVRDRFDCDRSDARPWLFGIAGNLLRRHRRRETRRWRAYARFPTGAVVPSLADVDDRVDADVLGAALGGALAAIPLVERDALLLFAWADLSYEQIADATGVPIGTVRTRIARARRRLRERLTRVMALDAAELAGTPDQGQDT
ncbi:MAG: RNA polymerase sigma factor [Acidimicrobiia bacterium]